MSKNKIILIIFLIIFFLIFTFIAPKLLLINTDNFYWAWMAKYFKEWNVWNEGRSVSLQTIMYPHFYGFLLIPFFKILPIEVYSPRFIFVVGYGFVALIIFGWHLLLKVNFGDKYQKKYLLWIIIAFFANYWMLNFILPGDISPKFLGVFLYLLFLAVFFKKGNLSKKLKKLIIIIILMFLFHSPDLVYLFASLGIYLLLFGRDLLNKYSYLYLIIIGEFFIVYRFVVQSLGWHDFHLGTIFYQYYSYSAAWLFRYYYFLVPILTIIAALYLIKKRTFNINRTNYFMLSQFFLAIIIVSFPKQWARSTELIWASYRNLLYLTIPMAWLSMECINRFDKFKFKYKTGILFLLFLLQFGFLAYESTRIALSRVIEVPEKIISMSPSSIKNKLIIIEKDQSLYRGNLEFVKDVDGKILKPSNGAILTRNWDISFIIGTILQSRRVIWYAKYEQIPFVFEYRSIFSQGMTKDEWNLLLEEKRIDWLIVDEYWLTQIPVEQFDVKNRVEYWEFNDKTNHYEPSSTYYLEKI